MSRAVARAQKRVAELAEAADGWRTKDGLHKRATRKLRRAVWKLERVKRASGA